MKIYSFGVLSIALFCTLAFGQHHHEDDLTNGRKSLQKITNSTNQFASNLYSHLASKYPNKNMFYSPASIAIAFSMLSLGARSQTLSQILETFRLNTSDISNEEIHKGFQQLQHVLTSDSDDLQLSSANALFVDAEAHLLPKFENDVKKFYESEAISTDFNKTEEAKNQINSYVENKTKGQIKDFIDTVNPDTVVFIINAIHFKGKWENAFNKSLTMTENFYVDENTVVKVPMMFREGNYPFAFLQEFECDVVEVPYKGNISAIIILPYKGKLYDVEKTLKNISLQTLTEKLRPRPIQLSMPRFSMSESLDLKNELSEMGITNAFTDNADLSGITAQTLKVSQAAHKGVMTLDEEGTEASGATGIEVIPVSIPPSVKCDRPFIFHILDKLSGIILFTGRIINPKN